MSFKVAINGFGRIGRNAFKIVHDHPELEVVAINDLTSPSTLAYLLKHDSNYGAYHGEVSSDDTHIIVDGKSIPVTAEKDPAALPWKSLGVDVVIESTGRFTDPDAAAAHLAAGAKRVVISAPVKSDKVGTFVIGVNEDKIDSKDTIISNGSCTTNCITPVAVIIDEAFGIEKAMMTTVHSYTASQSLQDAPSKDLREGRNAAENMVPTTTGAAISAAMAYPHLKDRFDGLSVRVPTPVVSLSDFTFVTKKHVTVEKVNEALREACNEERFLGVLSCTDEPLVSSDFIGDPHSAIVDLGLTRVVGNDLLKVVAWYDNEWGYCCRLVEQVVNVGETIGDSERAADKMAAAGAAAITAPTPETPAPAPAAETPTSAPAPEMPAEQPTDNPADSPKDKPEKKEADKKDDDKPAESILPSAPPIAPVGTVFQPAAPTPETPAPAPAAETPTSADPLASMPEPPASVDPLPSPITPSW